MKTIFCFTGRFALVAFFLLAAPGKEIMAAPAATNSWRSVLYPETSYAPSEANLETDKVLQDFSYAGYHGGAASIPDVAGPVFDATGAPYGADPTGATDSTDAIQSAIDAAGQGGGGVVFLPPGTYHLSVPSDRNHALLMNRPGVVLRGAGRDRTFLLNTTYSGMRSKVVIRVAGPHEAAFKAIGTAQSPLSRDLLNSTCVIPVASASSFQTGDTVVIRNDITDDWLNERGEPDWFGQNTNLGGLTYRRTVTAVDAAAGTITVDAPTRYVLKLRDNARVVRLALPPLAEVGLEDFAIGNVENPGTEWEQSDNSIPGKPSYEVCGSFLLMLERTRDCWVRRLSTFQAEGNNSTSHVLSSCLDVRESTHVTVDDCSFQRPQCGGNGGNGYMFRLYHSGECLIQHSQAQHSRHGFMVGGIGASGNVIHDCTDATTGHACGATGSHATSGRSNDFHECFSQACLVDVCTGDDSFWEAAYRGGKGANPHHNLTATHCVYWNTNGEGTLKEALVQSEQAGYGYVIGTRGPRSRVELPRLFPSATDPVDHVEGEGEGDTLVPFSLFEDQVRRRLGFAGPRPTK
jgi:hypothetical protein